RPLNRAADRRFLPGTGRPAAPAARLYPCPRESSPAMPLNSAKPSEFARIREGFHRHATELRFPPIVARYGCRLLFAAPPPLSSKPLASLPESSSISAKAQPAFPALRRCSAVDPWRK